MHAEIDLTQIALIVLMTLGCGLVFEKFKQPAVLGYIVGGIILSSLNMAGDRVMISALAELGVIMLLFLIGLELSIQSFKKIWAISLGVTAVQIIVSALVVLGLGQIFHMSMELAVVLAFSIALSSTAVAIKMLESIGELRTETGRLAVGILIAQDLVIVPMIIFVRSMGGTGMGWNVLIKIALAVGILIALVLFLSRHQRINIPFAHLFSGHEDLQPLVAMLFCFGMASLTGVLQLSPAYGAFLGGLIIGNSSERQSMLHITKPIQSVLLMVFFLSVGLLLDFQFIWDRFLKVMLLLIFITLGKTVLNIIVLHFLNQPWPRAFLAGLILSQMGEFAFVLATVGADAKVIDNDGRQLIVSLAALSLAFSPIWLVAARRLHELTPRLQIKTADELIHTAYGPELKVLEKVRRTCQAIVRTAWQSKSKLPKDKSDNAQSPTTSPPRDDA